MAKKQPAKPKLPTTVAEAEAFLTDRALKAGADVCPLEHRIGFMRDRLRQLHTWKVVDKVEYRKLDEAIQAVTY